MEKTRLLSLLFAALLSAGAFGQQRVVNVNAFREDAATMYARNKGLFAKEGLDVRFTLTRNSTDQMRGLSKGQYDLVSTAFDNVLYWSGREGAELVAVSQIVDSTVYPILARPEIRQWSDLKGRKLAADAVDTAFALVLRRVLLDKGLDYAKGDYQLVAVGATGFRVESMKKGETFAGVVTPPDDSRAIAEGLVRLGDSAQSLPDFPHTLFATNRAWAQAHRAELVSFIKAWLAASRAVRSNKDEAASMVAAQLKLNPKVAAAAVNEVSASGALRPKGLEMVLGLRTQFGMTPPMGGDISKYYDTSIHQAAASQLK